MDLAKDFIKGKADEKKAIQERKISAIQNDADWETKMADATKDSWKDELWTIVFVAILCMNFIPSMQEVMAIGFANLETTPLWVQWGMYASIAASFGIRTMKGLKK